MRYPVDVYTGKIQAYPEGKPSAIAKIQVDGELMLTELGLEGDEQAEKKVGVIGLRRDFGTLLHAGFPS